MTLQRRGGGPPHSRKGPQNHQEARRSGCHAKRTPNPTPHNAASPARPVGGKGRPRIVHTSLYLPEAVYEGLREAAFKERVKIHDIVLEGIESALRKRGRKR